MQDRRGKWRVMHKTAFGGVIAAILLLMCPGWASAQVVWYVHGVFTDGTKLTGSFSVNQYDDLAGFNLTTHTQGDVNGQNYTGLLNPSGFSSTSVTAYDQSPIYDGALFLQFSGDVTTGSIPTLSILTSSYECEQSYACPTDTLTRYLEAGSYITTTAPEPSTWALLLAGFAGVGGALRIRGRTKRRSLGVSSA
jgi:hypothetical protein